MVKEEITSVEAIYLFGSHANGNPMQDSEGMSCNHCKMAVENAIKGVAGVTAVQVDLAKKEAVVSGSPERAALVEAVDDAGYKVVK